MAQRISPLCFRFSCLCSSIAQSYLHLSVICTDFMALINDFLSLIYPSYCRACGQVLYAHETMICRLCRLTLPKSYFHRNPENPIAQLLGGRVPLKRCLCL